MTDTYYFNLYSHHKSLFFYVKELEYMVKLNKIESGNMINLSQCRKYADKIDDAAAEVKSLINIYEDACYYIKKNKSNDSAEYAAQLAHEVAKLRNIKSDLNSISAKIREKANQIYHEEIAEQKRKEAAAATNRI